MKRCLVKWIWYVAVVSSLTFLCEMTMFHSQGIWWWILLTIEILSPLAGEPVLAGTCWNQIAWWKQIYGRIAGIISADYLLAYYLIWTPHYGKQIPGEDILVFWIIELLRTIVIIFAVLLGRRFLKAKVEGPYSEMHSREIKTQQT